jgi:hypothetical protein
MKLTVKKEDRCSPNGAIATVAIAVFLFSVLCGRSLWVPASRITDLHVRAIALSLTDAASAFASSTGLDSYVPSFRESFLAVSGLANHPDWDSRYFNRRDEGSGSDVAPATRDAANGVVAAATSQPLLSSGSGFAMISGGMPLTVASEFSPVTDPSSNPPLSIGVGVSSVHSRDNPLRVFFFGDSQVFSLGSGLSRLAGKGSALSIDILAIHSSGFIRSDYYDWPTKLRDTFGQSPYEAAVMMLGMNDHQSFRDDSGAILRKGTEEWESAYREKCRAMIDLVLAFVPRVYWIGMPVVKNGAYEAGLSYIDAIQNDVASEYSPDVLVRVSIRDEIPGVGKPYADSVARADGKSLRVMSQDGSHFTVEGGQLAMKPLFEMLCRDFPFSEVPVANLPE